jgi:O-acetyl-ADP-ribose deacetylase (regulator of RNase III)
VRDAIADELREKMQGRQLVNPGEVVSTSAGALERSHRVKRIFHVASVYGVVGAGFHAIANAEQCVANALARLDAEASGFVAGRTKSEAGGEKRTASSMLFPLLATGTARADIIQSARRQVGTAVNYLRSRGEFTCAERVYFLAPDETVRAGLRVALAELGVIKPKPAATKANRSRKPVERPPKRAKSAPASSVKRGPR